jgi:hypothetical protein
MVQRLTWISKQIACKEAKQAKHKMTHIITCHVNMNSYLYINTDAMFYSFSGLTHQQFIANLDFKTLKTGQADPGSASLRTFFLILDPPLTSTLPLFALISLFLQFLFFFFFSSLLLQNIQYNWVEFIIINISCSARHILNFHVNSVLSGGTAVIPSLSNWREKSMSPPIGRAGSQEGGAGPPGKTILHALLFTCCLMRTIAIT